ncbi:AAA domain-containing protein, partial [Mycoplasma sp. 1012]
MKEVTFYIDLSENTPYFQQKITNKSKKVEKDKKVIDNLMYILEEYLKPEIFEKFFSNQEEESEFIPGFLYKERRVRKDFYIFKEILEKSSSYQIINNDLGYKGLSNNNEIYTQSLNFLFNFSTEEIEEYFKYPNLNKISITTHFSSKENYFKILRLDFLDIPENENSFQKETNPEIKIIFEKPINNSPYLSNYRNNEFLFLLGETLTEQKNQLFLGARNNKLINFLKIEKFLNFFIEKSDDKDKEFTSILLEENKDFFLYIEDKNNNLEKEIRNNKEILIRDINDTDEKIKLSFNSNSFISIKEKWIEQLVLKSEQKRNKLISLEERLKEKNEQISNFDQEKRNLQKLLFDKKQEVEIEFDYKIKNELSNENDIQSKISNLEKELTQRREEIKKQFKTLDKKYNSSQNPEIQTIEEQLKQLKEKLSNSCQIRKNLELQKILLSNELDEIQKEISSQISLIELSEKERTQLFSEQEKIKNEINLYSKNKNFLEKEDLKFYKLKLNIKNDEQNSLQRLKDFINDEVKNEKDFINKSIETNFLHSEITSAFFDFGLLFKYKRYYNSLRNLKRGIVKNPYIPIAIYNPEFIKSKNDWETYQIKTKISLNIKQQEIIKKAMFSPAISYLQGPPGTGKTQTICALIDEIITEEKGNVLISSSTHEAIENVFDRLFELKKDNPNFLFLKKITKNRKNNIFSEERFFQNWFSSLKSNFKGKILDDYNKLEIFNNKELKDFLENIEKGGRINYFDIYLATLFAKENNFSKSSLNLIKQNSKIDFPEQTKYNGEIDIEFLEMYLKRFSSEINKQNEIFIKFTKLIINHFKEQNVFMSYEILKNKINKPNKVGQFIGTHFTSDITGK